MFFYLVKELNVTTWIFVFYKMFFEKPLLNLLNLLNVTFSLNRISGWMREMCLMCVYFCSCLKAITKSQIHSKWYIKPHFFTVKRILNCPKAALKWDKISNSLPAVGSMALTYSFGKQSLQRSFPWKHSPTNVTLSNQIFT